MRPILGAVVGGVGSAVLVAGLSVSAIKAACGTFTRGKNTHLVVSEERIKHLVMEVTGTGVQRRPLRERNRDGSAAAADYVVPEGRVFILTDICPGPVTHDDLRLSEGFQFTLLSGGAERLSFFQIPFTEFPGGNPVLCGWHPTGGVAFDPGSTPAIEVIPIGGTRINVQMHVIGYEADDACP